MWTNRSMLSRGWSLLLAGSLALLILLLMAPVACSDDDGGTPADAGADATVAGKDTGPRKDSGPDRGADLTPDAPQSGCSAQVIGKACTKGGSECGNDHTCLVLSGTKGHCTCTCTEDDLSTSFSNEDTCPGDTFQCASVAVGGTAKQPYCFKAVGGGKAGTSSWWTSDDTTTPAVIGAKVVPGSFPFTVAAVGYKLTGQGKYCDVNLAHTVSLLVSKDADPPASPTYTATFAEAKGSATGFARRLVKALATPQTMAAGQSAFLMIDITVDPAGSKAVCIQSAAASNGTKQLYRSKSATAPHTWEKISPPQAELSLLGF